MSNNSLIPLILILVLALFVSWALFIIVRFVQETAKSLTRKDAHDFNALQDAG